LLACILYLFAFMWCQKKLLTTFLGFEHFNSDYKVVDHFFGGLSTLTLLNFDYFFCWCAAAKNGHIEVNFDHFSADARLQKTLRLIFFETFLGHVALKTLCGFFLSRRFFGAQNDLEKFRNFQKRSSVYKCALTTTIWSSANLFRSYSKPHYSDYLNYFNYYGIIRCHILKKKISQSAVKKTDIDAQAAQVGADDSCWRTWAGSQDLLLGIGGDAVQRCHVPSSLSCFVTHHQL
jgi:hypothetical protein